MTGRFPAVTGKDVLRALQRVGWNVFHIRGSHHRLRHNETGRKVTLPIHAGKTLRRGTLAVVLEKTGLSVEQFRKLL